MAEVHVVVTEMAYKTWITYETAVVICFICCHWIGVAEYEILYQLGGRHPGEN